MAVIQPALIEPALWAVAGYLLGSVPFGLLLTRLAGLGDIRAIGSGNIGATNVLRTGHKGLAAATLLLDGGKGAAAVLLAQHFSPDGAAIAGAGAFIGHLYPVWLRFKGGKGVATFIGIILVLCWQAAVGFGLIWLAIAALLRYSSLAGMVACLTTPLIAGLMGRYDVAALTFGMTMLVLLKHEANIRRLVKGQEPKIGQKKNDQA